MAHKINFYTHAHKRREHKHRELLLYSRSFFIGCNLDPLHGHFEERLQLVHVEGLETFKEGRHGRGLWYGF